MPHLLNTLSQNRYALTRAMSSHLILLIDKKTKQIKMSACVCSLFEHNTWIVFLNFFFHLHKRCQWKGFGGSGVVKWIVLQTSICGIRSARSVPGAWCFDVRAFYDLLRYLQNTWRNRYAIKITRYSNKNIISIYLVLELGCLSSLIKSNSTKKTKKSTGKKKPKWELNRISKWQQSK